MPRITIVIDKTSNILVFDVHLGSIDVTYYVVTAYVKLQINDYEMVEMLEHVSISNVNVHSKVVVPSILLIEPMVAKLILVENLIMASTLDD